MIGNHNSLEYPSLEYLSDLLGSRVASIDLIKGGRNSRTFKAIGEIGSDFVVKQYLDLTFDGVSRLAAEFSSLEFLHNKGVTSVPKPVVADQDRQYAFYELVKGTKVESSQATTADIDQMCDFLLRLRELRNDADAVELPNASEACFSIQSIIRNLDIRLGRLQAVCSSSTQLDELGEFICNKYTPVFQRTIAWCQNRIANARSSMDLELDQADRTLSPSDFGFHNCIRRHDGELVFLDFEYFGWDDPAKTICDFLLHPGMNLSYRLKQRFVGRVLGTPDLDWNLLERVENVYPLFGLKWCMILLNPFLSSYRRNRGLPGIGSLAGDDLLQQQLAKSDRMLDIVENECLNFPYRGGEYVFRAN